MKKKIIVSFICASIAVCTLTACGSSNKENSSTSITATSSASSESSSETTEEVSTDARAMLVTIVNKYISTQNLGITTPDISTGKWSFVYDSRTGFYNATVTGKDAEGNNDIVSAWVELKDDTSYSIHYFDTKDGVLIDDGQVPD